MGTWKNKCSTNLVEALKYACAVGAKIGGIVGRDGGYTAQVATACVLVPVVNPAHVTPHSEAFQAVVWHLLVSGISRSEAGADPMGIGSLSPPRRRAVFLDRDGVLNRAIVRDGKPYPPSSVAELEIFPEARAQLEEDSSSPDLLLVAVTNQPDVARAARNRGTSLIVLTRC